MNNPTDSAWYGNPEVRIYSTDEEVNPDNTFLPSDLLYKSNGVLTTGIDEYTWTPIDSVEFVPANAYRWGWAIVEIDHNELRTYSYYLWGFVGDGV